MQRISKPITNDLQERINDACKRLDTPAIFKMVPEFSELEISAYQTIKAMVRKSFGKLIRDSDLDRVYNDELRKQRDTSWRLHERLKEENRKANEDPIAREMRCLDEAIEEVRTVKAMHLKSGTVWKMIGRIEKYLHGRQAEVLNGVRGA